mgnify:CR=1 FL=1
MIRVKLSDGEVHTKRGDSTTCGIKTRVTRGVVERITCLWCVAGVPKPEEETAS